MIILDYNTKETVEELWQYDYGETLRIQGGNLQKAQEVHFSLNGTGGDSVTRIGVTKDNATYVIIPDSMLENNSEIEYLIYVFLYNRDSTSGETTKRFVLNVRSRPKPEHTGGTDGNAFGEVVEEVRKSAERAEAAQAKAEKYATQTKADATQTALDREKVKEMVDTVSNISAQVETVKNYAAQAQEASTNALQAQAGAETAEGMAEQHALEVAGNKAEVERLATQVRQDKTEVEQTTQGFGNTVQQAEQSINTAKTNAVKEVQTEGTTQVRNVTTEGEKQVKVVADKGTEVLQSIPQDFTTQMGSKLDKQQGVENNGKILGIGEDGLVVPVEKPSGTSGGETWRLLRTVTVPAAPKTDQSGVVWKLNSDGAVQGFAFDTDENGDKFSVDDVRWYGTVKCSGMHDGHRYFYLKDINNHSIAGYRMWYETCNAVYGTLNRTGNRLYPLETYNIQFDPTAKIKNGCGNSSSGFVTNYKYTCFGMACEKKVLEEGTVYHIYGKE